MPTNPPLQSGLTPVQELAYLDEWVSRHREQRRVPKRLRELIFERDGRCCCCGTDEGRLTIDHFIPRCKGGTNHSDNLLTLCRRCNNKKGDLLPAEWYERLRKTVH